MKNNEKKCHLKNDKVEYILLYHFLNDENHTHTMSPWKKHLIRSHVLKHESMEAAFAVLIFVYTRSRRA